MMHTLISQVSSLTKEVKDLKKKKKKGETILYTVEYNINKIYRNVMTGHFLKALTTYHCHQVLHHQFPLQFLPQSSLVRVQKMVYYVYDYM